MTPETTAALRQLLVDASPAPWRVDFAFADGTHEISHEDILVAYSSGTRANAELIAALRNDVPGLLDELDRARLRDEAFHRYLDLAKSEVNRLSRELERLRNNAALLACSTMGEAFDRLEQLVAAERERDRFREHSVMLNSILWRAAEVLGEVPEGAEQIPHDRDRVDRLIADRERLSRELAETRAQRDHAARFKDVYRDKLQEAYHGLAELWGLLCWEDGEERGEIPAAELERTLRGCPDFMDWTFAEEALDAPAPANTADEPNDYDPMTGTIRPVAYPLPAVPGADEQTASVWVHGIHHAASRWGGKHCQACGDPWPCPVAAPVAGTADEQGSGGERDEELTPAEQAQVAAFGAGLRAGIAEGRAA